MSAPLPDAAARRLALTEFERPVALEAGAGTGKTRTLVARLGTWLLGPGWERARTELADEGAARGEAPAAVAEIAARACEGVRAITFTDAAAAEMAERVGRLLAQAAAREPPDDLREIPFELGNEELAARAAALLAASPRLGVSTIHGYCHALLAGAPLEAGLHPGFEVDPDDGETRALATELLLARLRRGEPELVELLAAGVDPPAVLDALTRLAAAGVSADELAADPFGEERLAPPFAELERALDRLLAVAAPLRSGRTVESIPEGLAALDRLRAALAGAPRSAEGLAALAPELKRASESAKKILVDWASGKLGKTEEKALGGAAQGLVPAAADLARAHAALAELEPGFTRRARRALAGALAETQARRRAQGIVSYDDLLAGAARLVAERAEVRARVRRGLRQLLVDEFQDTDRRQCELLRALVFAPSPAPAPGLFLVGDPQQSIYGWRSADLAAYAAFLDELAARGGRFGRLSVNFRSAPPILREVERALAPVLVEERSVQAGFQPLAPARAGARGFDAAGRAPVEYWASWDRARRAERRPTSAERAGEIEAAAIARDVRELVDAGAAAWGDFALLLRSRGDLETFLDAFRRAGVPYVVQKDRSYYRRREVVDALAAVRTLLDPGDLLALVTFFRSPFVGLPDAAWLPLWGAGFPAAMIDLDGERGRERALAALGAAAAREPAGLPESARAPGWWESARAAVEAVARLRAEFRAVPAADWIERLRARLLVEPIAAARFLGRFGLANLERLFVELEELLEAEPDPARALAALRAAIAEEREAEEARPPEEQPDAVSVLTVHAAKGLEFRHVYLAQAHRQSGERASRALPELELGPPGPPREMVLFGAPTPGWRALAERRRRVAAAEAGRLLYVAATRAIDRLVVCGRWPEPGEGARRTDERAPSFAELLAPRLAAAPPLTDESPRRSDAGGVVWRLADEGAAPLAAAAAAAPGAPEPETGVEVLARRREAARLRASRPRFAAASSLAVAPGPLPVRAGAARDRSAARARGAALHRALALQTLAERDAAAWRRAAHAALRAERPAAGDGEHAALDAALDALTASQLWRRLSALATPPGPLLARELPLVLAAGGRDAEAGASDPARAPLDGWIGALDLLYRDPESGALVVADFKSDEVEGPEGAAALAERYRGQLELYGRAVAAGLGLAAPPRLELWLLALDAVVRVEPR